MSATMRGLEKVLRLSRIRDWLVTQRKIESWAANPRRPYSGRPGLLVRMKADVARNDLAGWPVYEMTPKLPASSQVDGHLLYLHGGGYVLDLVGAMHLPFIAKAGVDLRRTVTVPIYPLAPEHTYREAYRLLLDVYRRILTTHDPKSIVFMGDSAGGGLALGLCHAAREVGMPQPRDVVLLSPWLHVGFPSPDVAAVAEIDPILNLELMREVAARYAGGDPLDHPLLSPAAGPLTDLPRVTIVTGTHDLLNPDARAFRDRARDEGVDIGWYEIDGGIHGWLSKDAWRYVRGVLG
ncbi:alpha/beta hydrolase [Mycolicibacterium stellerae]|uniref:alpha/beta hydrolase n=1 Tax=Mycolicibacterium stellerae TaxID=2358193 RepID=UPI0013DDF80D|nr:alpha/beta hydrolase [Mycolicibacterium stellerae]